MVVKYRDVNKKTLSNDKEYFDFLHINYYYVQET